MFGKPSTGIMAVYVLKDLCKSLTVYGIGTHNAVGEVGSLLLNIDC